MKNDMIGELIHFGSPHLVISHFRPVENVSHFCKPRGGLWASPVNSEFGWKEWCRREDFRLHELESWFTFIVSGRTLTIDSLFDLDKMDWQERPDNWPLTLAYSSPDYESMSKKWDIIHLTEAGERRTRMLTGRNLYGWDCESVLILNPVSSLKETGSSEGEKK